jgi:hypothetical protein
VWDLGESTRFEHAEANWDSGLMSVRVRDLDHLETRLEASAYDTRHQDGANSRAKGPRDDGTDLVQTLAGGLVWGVALLQDRLAPGCIPGLRRYFASGLHESEQGKGW